MSAAVSLPTPKRPGQLQVLSDRFVCSPYRATLTAKACIGRQRAAKEQGPKTIYEHCFNCSIGRGIAERLGDGEIEVTQCAKPECGAGATRGRWCAVHFRVAPEAARDRAAHRKALEPHLEAIRPKRDPKPSNVIHAQPLELLRAEDQRDETRVTMAKCKRPGCKRDADPTRGYGDLCMPHHRGVVNAQIQTGKPKRKGAGATSASTTSRASAPPPAPRAPARAKARPKPRPAPKEQSVDGLLRRAVEAVELVETIGWDLARDIAARVKAS